MSVNCRIGRTSRRGRRGSVLAETVIVMPLLLLLIFGVVQVAHIWTAKQMAIYAAYCATRAIMVVPSGEQEDAALNAAEVALSWINIADSRKGDEVTIPGWGRIVGSGTSSERRVKVEVKEDGQKKEVASVEVKYKFPLVFPGMGVNKIFAHFVNSPGVGPIGGDADIYGDLYRNTSVSTIDGWPYIEFTETCVLPMPYSTENFPKGAFRGVNIRGG